MVMERTNGSTGFKRAYKQRDLVSSIKIQIRFRIFVHQCMTGELSAYFIVVVVATGVKQRQIVITRLKSGLWDRSLTKSIEKYRLTVCIFRMRPVKPRSCSSSV